MSKSKFSDALLKTYFIRREKNCILTIYKNKMSFAELEKKVQEFAKEENGSAKNVIIDTFGSITTLHLIVCKTDKELEEELMDNEHYRQTHKTKYAVAA